MKVKFVKMLVEIIFWKCYIHNYNLFIIINIEFFY